MEGLVDCNLFAMISLLMEIDMYTEWVPNIAGKGLVLANEVELLSKISKVGFFHFGLPWPLQDRDMLVLGYGVDLLAEGGKILLVLKNLEEHKDVPTPGGGITRVKLHAGGVLFQSITEKTCHVSYIFNVDPQLAYMPSWLLNFLMKTFAGAVWERMSSHAQAIDRAPEGKYAQRMKERPELYNMLKKRLVTAQNLSSIL
eukprot:TRINITY_DN9556_c0_g1_i2.p1 TRINITY_DN9556_c0_g1~~TRINITY_DN9556_c0_g1_i2.p1  ORF type:complete len:200 (+),score=26.22 TRINITY_DN9556_c0_g1_i2:161-760(+)